MDYSHLAIPHQNVELVKQNAEFHQKRRNLQLLLEQLKIPHLTPEEALNPGDLEIINSLHNIATQRPASTSSLCSTIYDLPTITSNTSYDLSRPIINGVVNNQVMPVTNNNYKDNIKFPQLVLTGDNIINNRKLDITEEEKPTEAVYDEVQSKGESKHLNTTHIDASLDASRIIERNTEFDINETMDGNKDRQEDNKEQATQDETTRTKEEKIFPVAKLFSSIPQQPIVGQSTTMNRTSTMNDIITIVSLIDSTDYDKQMKGVLLVRHDITNLGEKRGIIDVYIKAGLLSVLARVLMRDSPEYVSTDTLYEILWVLTNISSGTTTEATAVYDVGVVPRLVDLVSSRDPRVSTQAAWVLGNLSGDSAHLRDAVLAVGAISYLYRALRNQPHITTLRIFSWTFSNIVRHKPLRMSNLDKQCCIEAIIYFLYHSDVQIQVDACWSIIYFAKSDEEIKMKLLETGALPRLMDLANGYSNNVVAAARRATNTLTVALNTNGRQGHIFINSNNFMGGPVPNERDWTSFVASKNNRQTLDSLGAIQHNNWPNKIETFEYDLPSFQATRNSTRNILPINATVVYNSTHGIREIPPKYQVLRPGSPIRNIQPIESLHTYDLPSFPTIRNIRNSPSLEVPETYKSFHDTRDAIPSFQSVKNIPLRGIAPIYNTSEDIITPISVQFDSR